jgi:hypothetical protein
MWSQTILINIQERERYRKKILGHKNRKQGQHFEIFPDIILERYQKTYLLNTMEYRYKKNLLN